MAWRRALLLLSLLLLGATSRADDRAEAKKAYREASAQYDLGNYEEASKLFKKAYLLREDPSFLFNMAQCERQLHHREEAVKVYRSYLRNVPNAPNRASVEQTIAQLEAEQAAEAEQQRQREAAAAAAAAAAKPAPEPTPAVAATPAPVEKKPVYKKWWLWTAVGGAAVALGLGLGLGLGLQHGSHFDTTLPTLGLGKAAALVQF